MNRKLMLKRPAIREQIVALKKRRDQLLNRACNRQERPAILEEVRQINREVHTLEKRFRAK